MIIINTQGIINIILEKEDSSSLLHFLIKENVVTLLFSFFLPIIKDISILTIPSFLHWNFNFNSFLSFVNFVVSNIDPLAFTSQIVLLFNFICGFSIISNSDFSPA